MRPPLFSLSTLVQVSKAIVNGEPTASEWPMRQTNFCCARRTAGAARTPTASAAARWIVTRRARFGSTGGLVFMRCLRVVDGLDAARLRSTRTVDGHLPRAGIVCANVCPVNARRAGVRSGYSLSRPLNFAAQPIAQCSNKRRLHPMDRPVKLKDLADALGLS